MTHFKTLLLTLTGVSMAQASLAQVQTPFQTQKMAHDLMRLNSSLLHGQQQKYTNVFGRISSRFEMPEVNSELVRRHEQKFAKESAYLNRTIKRSEPYLHHVATEVERRNMPGEIALLPFIESAFVIKAKSPVGASGLWQFMPATGKDYGLDQTYVYDGRHDVYASTDAALNYLEYLYGLFGDWSLALAAYNWGQGNVSRAIKRAESQGLLPVYENLNMPQETRNYAPKLLAWRNILHNPAAFGVQIPHINDEAYFQAIDINTPIETTVAARLAGISHDEFLRLNPGPNLPVFIPAENRKILLPTAAANQFMKNYQASKAEDLLSYQVYTPQYSEKADDVAASFGMSYQELRQLNGLKGNTLSSGLPVLVAKNRSPLQNTDASLQHAVLEMGANFLQQPAVTVRQADSLSKPQAQLAGALPIKMRGSHTPYGYATPAALAGAAMPISNQNFAASEIERPVSHIQVAQAESFTHTTPAVNTASLTPTVNLLQTPKARTSQQMATADPLSNLMNHRSNTRPTPAVQAVAKAPVATPSVAINTPVLQENMVLTQAPSTQNMVLEAANIPKLQDNMALTQAVNITENQASANQITDANTVATDIQAASIELTEVQTTPIAALQLDENHAANSVRLAIERENEREAREEARLAKLQAEAEKRERQLANANEHKVSSGETLYSIAKTYDMQVSELLAANGLESNTIKVGQTLKVGKAADKAIQLAQAKDSQAQKKQATKDQNTPKNVNYVVRKGDTLMSIAGKFNVQVNDLKKWNNTGSNLQPGQKLMLRQL